MPENAAGASRTVDPRGAKVVAPDSEFNDSDGRRSAALSSEGFSNMSTQKFLGALAAVALLAACGSDSSSDQAATGAGGAGLGRGAVRPGSHLKKYIVHSLPSTPVHEPPPPSL